jgi:zinc protease
MRAIKDTIRISLLLSLGCLQSVVAQPGMPVPGAPQTVTIPAVKETSLPNGLKIAVIERKSIPLVTIELLLKNGANIERADQAGLANMTLSLLTKGTTTRSATEIAEQIEFLGGSINTGAGWNSSAVTISIMSDKIDKALEIMSDVISNPAFKQEEIDLLKSQSLDNLTYNLKQPGFLGNYVASAYSFNEHPSGGTPESLKGITRQNILDFHRRIFEADNAVIIFTGDISQEQATLMTKKYFEGWKSGSTTVKANVDGKAAAVPAYDNIKSLAKRILIVDLPGAGQASVKYLKNLTLGRIDKPTSGNTFFPASVLNSILGGGFSSRLNQEIRIKRGLSYGAGSGFSWRRDESNFMVSTQTKNESAAEVAQLVLEEIVKLGNSPIETTELNPRKLVLTGNFSRNLETTAGLADAVAELYTFGLSTNELNSYMENVQKITDEQVRNFAKSNLSGGDIIIVGDYTKFKDNLKNRFPDLKFELLQADKIDLTEMK